jgi:hypothetical protein
MLYGALAMQSGETKKRSLWGRSSERGNVVRGTSGEAMLGAASTVEADEKKIS